MKRFSGLLLFLMAAAALADSPSASDSSSARKASTSARSNQQAGAEVAPITWTSEAEMNQYFVFRFVHTIGNGESRMPPLYMSVNNLMRLVPEDKSTPSANQNTGNSNATKPGDSNPNTRTADGSASASTNADPDAFRIENLDLVGIAKHEQPVAYSQKSFRGADEHATRKLNDFEAKAVAELQSGQELIIENNGKSRNILGAIRAGKACLECHDNYKKGDLLGAFSYRLISAAPLDAAAEKDQNALRGMQANQTALQIGTVLGRLELTRMILQSAADSLEKASPAEHGSELTKLNSAIERAQSKVAAMMDYVEEHPDTNSIGVGRKADAMKAIIRLPSYAAFWHEGFIAGAEYSGSGFVGTGTKNVALSAENEHGIRIDQDGKGISAPSASAMSFLQQAQRQFYGPNGIAGSESNGLGKYRDGVLTEIVAAADSAKRVLDHVHETIHGTPAVVTYTGPGIRPNEEAAKEKEPAAGAK